MLKRRKFAIGGIIVILAVAYLVYAGISSSTTYYYTVDEFMTKESTIRDANVRVNGVVAPGSLEEDSLGLAIRFKITDTEGQISVPVFYKGTVPDTFKVGNEVVVEGYLNSDGVFQAHTLMPKCPSKYEPEV